MEDVCHFFNCDGDLAPAQLFPISNEFFNTKKTILKAMISIEETVDDTIEIDSEIDEVVDDSMFFYC